MIHAACALLLEEVELEMRSVWTEPRGCPRPAEVRCYCCRPAKLQRLVAGIAEGIDLPL